MCTIMKKQTASLAYLEQVRQHMSRLPSIDPTTRTLLVTGYPNVGKSSFMNSATPLPPPPLPGLVHSCGVVPSQGCLLLLLETFQRSLGGTLVHPTCGSACPRAACRLELLSQRVHTRSVHCRPEAWAAADSLSVQWLEASVPHTSRPGTCDLLQRSHERMWTCSPTLSPPSPSSWGTWITGTSGGRSSTRPASWTGPWRSATPSKCRYAQLAPAALPKGCTHTCMASAHCKQWSCRLAAWQMLCIPSHNNRMATCMRGMPGLQQPCAYVSAAQPAQQSCMLCWLTGSLVIHERPLTSQPAGPAC